MLRLSNDSKHRKISHTDQGGTKSLARQRTYLHLLPFHHDPHVHPQSRTVERECKGKHWEDLWRDLRWHVSLITSSGSKLRDRTIFLLRKVEEPSKLTAIRYNPLASAWSISISSILVLVYAYAMFQKRLTMIGSRDAGQFGEPSQSERPSFHVVKKTWSS